MELRYAVRYLEELSVVACIFTVSGGNAGLPQNLQTRNLQTRNLREEVSLLYISSCVELLGQ